ncbi:MAG TPA: hypothetical protein VKU94_03845 [Geobacterales bacterium]|nr:hypothetical protein [Geobacterales bacterium]
MAFHIEYASPQPPNSNITGALRDTGFPYHDYTSIRVGITNTGDICHLYVEQLEDGGTVWKETGRVPIPGDGAYRTFDFPISMRNYRISLQTGSYQTALFVTSTEIVHEGYYNSPRLLSYNIASGSVGANSNSAMKVFNLGYNHSFSKIRSAVAFDQPCTLVVEQSQDGVNWLRTESFDLTPATAGVMQATDEESNIVCQYVRTYVINGTKSLGSGFQHNVSLMQG